jgi:hypothetical protein
MYFNRTPTTTEQLYISRATQKIADLGATIAEELSRNDVTYSNVELVEELKYSIEVLYSTFLNWTEDDIQMMMDYYSVLGELTVYGSRVIGDFPSIGITGDIWATVPQLNAVNQSSIIRDQVLDTKINSEILRIEDIIANLQFDADGITSKNIVVQTTVGGVSKPKTSLLSDALQ